MAALTVAFGALGVALHALAGSAPEAAVRFADLSDAVFVEVRRADGEVVLSGELRDRIDPAGNVEKDAALVDRSGRRVIGEVEIEIPAAGAADRRQELEVDIISLSPGSTLHLFVNDRQVATFVTDDRGSVDFEVAERPGSGRS